MNYLERLSGSIFLCIDPMGNVRPGQGLLTPPLVPDLKLGPTHIQVHLYFRKVKAAPQLLG